MPTPRAAVIHDLSGFGRCSLTEVIPILSVMGVQCCPLPTAFLSTHTGGFQGFTFLDMTEELPRAAAHWKSLDLKFQAIYSGFLGSERQIGIVADFIRDFRGADTLVVVDPVMGDDGQAYQTYTPAMCAGMSRLAELADVITPNLTEAAFLLGQDYRQLLNGGRALHDEGALRALAEALSLEGKRSVALTGAALAPGQTGAMCFDARTGRTEAVQTEFVAHPLHGTGDIFASVLTGGLMRGESLREAAARAVDFIHACAVRTVRQGLSLQEGVDFEPLLGYLALPEREGPDFL